MKIIIPLVFLTACGGGMGPCEPQERAAIGARYNAALLASCDRDKPLDTCEAYPALRKRYEAEREEWTLCSRK